MLAEIEVPVAARVDVRKRTAVVIIATGTTFTDTHRIGPCRWTSAVSRPLATEPSGLCIRSSEVLRGHEHSGCVAR